MNNEREMLTCSICNVEIEPENQEHSLGNGDIICEDCNENHTFICEDCNELCSTDEGRWIDGNNKSVCNDCFTHNYSTCNDCGNTFANDDLENINGYNLCESCKGENFTTCYNCNEYINYDEAIYSEENGAYYCRDCYDETRKNESLYPYHSEIGREDKSNNSQYKIGIEIEKEDSIHTDYCKEEILADTGWVLEKDSSLDDDTGFEAISPIYPLNNRKIKQELKKIKWVIEARQSSSCGGHIHISDKTRTPRELLQAMSGYYPILYAMYPNRLNGGYSQAKKLWEYEPYSHNQAFNPSDKTLELRIFPSPRSIKSLMFRCKLIKFMLDNPEPYLQGVISKMIEPKKGKKEKQLLDILREVYDDEKILEVIIKAQVYAQVYNDELINGNISKEQIKKINNLIKK